MTTTLNKVENVSIDELKRGLADGSVLLVDVREPNEFVAGHIPGSILNPLQSFDASKLPKEAGKRIVLLMSVRQAFADRARPRPSRRPQGYQRALSGRLSGMGAEGRKGRDLGKRPILQDQKTSPGLCSGAFFLPRP